MSSSLSTPNFSSDALGKHTDYIQELSRKYAALSKVVQEEQSLESGSPQADEGRILALRGRIQEAWSRADGNPASGKWVLLSQLLRMGITSGRGGKWVGARADVKPQACPDGWLCTTSESDWNEWERKFIQDQRLKNMVETWKKGVKIPNHQVAKSQINAVSHPAAKASRGSRVQKESGVVSDKQSLKSVPTTSMDPLRDSAPFGFGVVKRSGQTNVLSGKNHAAGNKQPYYAPNLPDVSEAPESSNGAISRNTNRPKEQTTNGTERRSMNHSFSGAQLVTSTPKQIGKPPTSLLTNPEVPSHIPLASSPGKRALLGRASSRPSPPGQSKTRENDLGSPSNRRQGIPVWLIPSPESPLRRTTSHPTNDTYMLKANNKRTLESSHSYPVAESEGPKLKKAKTSSDPDPDVKATPRTPPRGQVPTAFPTLTELLASSKKEKKKRPSGDKLSISDFAPKRHPSTSEPRLESKTNDTREERVVENAEEEPPFFFEPSPVDDDGGGGNIQEESHRAEYDFYSHLNDGMDLASRAKSLSSIAGASDDEEEEAVLRAPIAGEIEFVLDSSFHPGATSTQVQGGHQGRRGPFVSKSNLNNPVVTQPDDPSRTSKNGRNAADSWETIYAPHLGIEALPGPPAPSAAKNKSQSSFPELLYNSQFESAVAAQVEKVNKLLQRDVDYDGLLSKVPAELENEEDESDNSVLDGLESGKAGNSYGYGKAFEYDQSF